MGWWLKWGGGVGFEIVSGIVFGFSRIFQNVLFKFIAIITRFSIKTSVESIHVWCRNILNF